MKRLALCVDDFGLHDGVNDAVLTLGTLGRLNAVGCLVGAPAWSRGAPRLAGLDAARTDVGLHLDLTEFPLRPGMRRALPELIVRAYAGLLDRAGLRAEIDAQLDAFERARQRAPDYIDGHQHIHQLPVVRDALRAALAQRYPGQRPWLRSTRRAPQDLATNWKHRLIETLGDAALRRIATGEGQVQNRHLLGVHPFRADASQYRALLGGWLAAAGDGDLLMCHPSAPAAGTGDALMPARTAEFEVLCSAGFGQSLEQAGIVLAPVSRSCVVAQQSG